MEMQLSDEISAWLVWDPGLTLSTSQKERVLIMLTQPASECLNDWLLDHASYNQESPGPGIPWTGHLVLLQELISKLQLCPSLVWFRQAGQGGCVGLFAKSAFSSFAFISAKCTPLQKVVYPCFISIASVYTCYVCGGGYTCWVFEHVFSSGSKPIAAPIPLPCSLQPNPPLSRTFLSFIHYFQTVNTHPLSDSVTKTFSAKPAFFYLSFLFSTYFWPDPLLISMY